MNRKRVQMDPNVEAAITAADAFATRRVAGMAFRERAIVSIVSAFVASNYGLDGPVMMRACLAALGALGVSTDEVEAARGFLSEVDDAARRSG